MTESEKQIDSLEAFLTFIESKENSAGEENNEYYSPEPDPVSENSIPTEQIVKGILEASSGFAASRWGDVWLFQGNELDQLSDAYSKVIDEKFPDIDLSISPVLTAIGLTLMFSVPRYFAQKEINKSVKNSHGGDSEQSSEGDINDDSSIVGGNETIVSSFSGFDEGNINGD